MKELKIFSLPALIMNSTELAYQANDTGKNFCLPKWYHDLFCSKHSVSQAFHQPGDSVSTFILCPYLSHMTSVKAMVTEKEADCVLSIL